MRLLVIVSGHFGELSLARYFLGGLGAEPVPVMMVPAVLGQPPGLEPGVDIRTYDDLDDIERAVEECAPDVVILFSGYLLTIGRRFSLFKAFALLRRLRRRGARIVTSDPFIGLVRNPWSLRFGKMFAPRKGGGHDLVAAALAPLLAIRTYLIHLQLRRHPHLYAAPVAHRFPVSGHRGYAFFNPVSDPGVAAVAAPPDAAPEWLFVLSEIDFRYQTNRLGDSFAGHVAARLRDAARPGRRVAMIGPRQLIGELRGRLSDAPGVELRENVAYGDYMARVVRAQRLFLWNYFSFSVLHRVLAGGPVHYFDEGHMVSVLPELEQAGIDTYYAGWRPPLLDVAERIDEDRLDDLARETRERFARIKERMAAGMSPAALLEVLTSPEGAPPGP
jgi:hypothetical protein